MIRYIILLFFSITVVSCSNFFDTFPHDELSTSTTWKTEEDANRFVIGCYSGFVNGTYLLSSDCTSDIGYSHSDGWGWRNIGNGTLSASNTGSSYYDFTTIRRCNTFLENVDKVQFKDESIKKDFIAQVRTIRAYKYFEMNFWYGGVPIIDSYLSAEEAQVPRKTEEEVKQFIYQELDASIPDLQVMPSQVGRIAKATALAIKMRSALYWGDLERSLSAAQEIIKMQQYELDPDYSNLFTLAGKSSPEIIYAVQYMENVQPFDLIGKMYNYIDGGLSSIVPTQNLVDMYEMEDGLPKEESSLYNPSLPFYKRDPRMKMTILYPGQNWKAKGKDEVILNTLDKEIKKIDSNGQLIQVVNDNYYGYSINASQTGLSWAKYTVPMDQYSDIWKTSACPILFRYAEVLLSYAEAKNELNGPSDDVYEKLDLVRNRVGMPSVDRNKYSTKEKLRELIRRERTVEFAGEGLRRADILRWKDSSGKMLAESVLNEDLYRIVGTINYDETDPTRRAVIDIQAPLEAKKIETRKFRLHNRYYPIPQSSIDKNPNLKQNEGY
ncbi:MAG: RagB/SusD family nutrient uptake outer membrane protein [Parabacteroides sp.]|nr:RagB/SusD family nutrient uptake outer membrane protein [Parabacteroides sp.]